MSDAVTAKALDAKFKAHPGGQYVGQTVDVIDLGEKVQDYPGTVPYLAPTCAIVFRTGERNEEIGEYIDIAREFTVSMGDKSNLKKFLEQWRGREYTKEQIDAGVPLDKLTGNHALLTVAHRISAKKRTYANITACVGIPKQMAATVTSYPDYKRADYWQEKKKGYADEAAKFRASYVAQPLPDDELPGALLDEDDDLPF
jgi:hypothetical protein